MSGAGKVPSRELRPGTRVRYKPNGDIAVLARRKREFESSSLLMGWWVVDGGGLADVVIDADDSEWEVLDA
jgi:hypothetical protein